jgi:hypothetical protein
MDPQVRIWHARGQGLEVPLASGIRRAATERRRNQHDRWKSVTDHQITGRWQVRSPVAFPTIIHDP